MACEEFLEQIETAAIAMDEIYAEILQLQNQRAAQEGILMGSYMLYMNCLNNQNNGRQASTGSTGSFPAVSDVVKFAKKMMAKLRRKLKSGK